MSAWSILQADCVEAMAAMDECSVDAVVCDPPYGLEFMGRDWDRLTYAGGNPALKSSDRPITERDGEGWQPGSTYGGRQKNPRCKRCGAFKFQRESGRCKCPSPDWDTRHAETGFQMQAWHEAWAREALRVLKPGGHLIAFGGTRTYHRLVCGLEDAGFEIRDQLAWMFGSGFPKSLDVSRAIDKAAGAERDVVGEQPDRWTGAGGVLNFATDRAQDVVPITAGPATPDAERWQGWGTALKPGHEPIVLARKPLVGTVAANVLAHGTGAINVDGCRIEHTPGAEGMWGAAQNGEPGTHGTMGDGWAHRPTERHEAGRWPANVILDPEAAAMLDEQAGDMRDGVATNHNREVGAHSGNLIYGARANGTTVDQGYGGSGGASRFFYCSKTSSAERNAGLGPRANVHPTVKPIDLMRWLVRLITPPDGLVLDPFTGSGTTGCAALLEGMDFVGIEREPEYAAIARARIAWWAEHPDGMKLVHRLEHEAEAKAKAIAGQLDIFGEVA